MFNCWDEYVHDEQYRIWDWCDSCDGEGHHGIEEETGCLYICYGCGGTGKYPERVA